MGFDIFASRLSLVHLGIKMTNIIKGAILLALTPAQLTYGYFMAKSAGETELSILAFFLGFQAMVSAIGSVFCFVFGIFLLIGVWS